MFCYPFYFALWFSLSATHQVKKMPEWWAWEKKRLSIKGRWLKYFARSSTPSSLLLGVLQDCEQGSGKKKTVESLRTSDET